jgi:hypothetical protein
MMIINLRGLLIGATLLSIVPMGCSSGSSSSSCNVTDCMAGMNPCGKAACMIPYGGGNAVCEYAPKLTGGCRCWPGDKRPCTLSGGGSGLKTCVAHPTALETYWTACS